MIKSKKLIKAIVLMVCIFMLVSIPFTALANELSEQNNESKNVFTAEELKQDLDSMIKNMEEIHPNLYHSIDKETFVKEADLVKESFTDSMTDADFFIKASGLVAKLKDGHTWLGCAPSIENKLFNGGKVFPYKVKSLEGRIFVTDVINEDYFIPIGSEVTEINGIKTEDIIKNYVEHTSGELDHYKKLRIGNNFSLAYVNLYGFSNNYSITYKDPKDNKDKVINVEGIEYKKLLEYNKNKGSNYKNYSYKYLDDIHTGYIEFNRFYDFQGFDKFLKDTFKDMKDKKTENLIIDLRKNGGGDATLGKLLTCYLTDKEFRLVGSTITKVSPQLIEHWKNFAINQGYDFKLSEDNTEIEIMFGDGKMNFKVGTYTEDNIQAYRPFKVEDTFKGKVYVLTGGESFSSAVMFASIIKDYNIGTIIGEETGGVAGGYSDMTMFKLPNTQIRCSASHLYFTRPSGEECDRGIIPDYEVKVRAEDYFNNVDAALDYTKELIINKK